MSALEKKWKKDDKKIRKQYAEMQNVVETGEPAISFYMFSSYFLSNTVRKRYWAAGQSFTGSLKAPFKPKPTSVCALQEVILCLQKNR